MWIFYRVTPLDCAYGSKQFENAQILEEKGAVTTSMIEYIAAVTIQAAFKGYIERKKYQIYLMLTLPGNKTIH